MEATRPGRAAMVLAMLAVGLELCVSANLLTWIGIPYTTEGGALPLKLNPGTNLLIVASLLACAAGQSGRLAKSNPLLGVFFVAITTCATVTAVLTGAGNLIVLLDTFLPAGLLAAVLSRAPVGNLASLRRAMQILLAANALLALTETALQATLVPLYLNDNAYHPNHGDFRPTALFDHPLTGGIMMMIGLALAPAGKARLPYQLLLWAGLLAFGGRIALLMTLMTGIASAGQCIARQFLARRRGALTMLLASFVGLVAMMLLLVAGLQAGVGDRLLGHLYWDSSAQVRLAQWQIIGQLDVWQLLFGTPRADLLRMLNALRLSTGVEVVENFWLLLFVSTGVIGFPLFLAALAALCTWCWRRTGSQGRILLVSTMIVASTSNSLGRKSTLLVCLVAAILCLPRARPATRRAAADAWPGAVSAA